MKFPETKTVSEKLAARLSVGLIRRLHDDYKFRGLKRSGMYVLDIKADPLVDDGRDGVYSRLQFQDGENLHNAIDWVKESFDPLFENGFGFLEVIRYAEMDFEDMLRQLNSGGYDEDIDFDDYIKQINFECN